MVAPRSVLVTGASKGIGLQICKEFLKNPEIAHVIAACRHPDGANELNEIEDGRLTIVQMDVTKDDQIDRAINIVSNVVGEHGLNMLVNNAGIFLNYETDQEADRKVLMEQLNTNVVSVAVVTQKFLPLLKRAAERFGGNQLSPARASVINITSGMGSIGQQSQGSFSGGVKKSFAYRMSKAAVNSMTKTMSYDLKDSHILVVAFCPGWCQTDMGGPNATQTVEESVGQLVPNIYKLDGHYNGSFLQHTGGEIMY